MPKFVRRPRKYIRKGTVCAFCKQKIVPNYKDVETLKRSLSERGKLIGRRESGVCQKHQRVLAISVKRARFLALVPYVVRPS